MEGGRLTLLAIYLLASAYSRREKLPEQIARRIQAASVQEQIQHLDAERTNDVLSAIQWKVGDMLPVINDVLAMVICYTKVKTFNPNARLVDLMPTTDLVNQRVISTTAGALLEQARLVYTNYHSTSIHFVLPIIDMVTNLVGNAQVVLGPEITHFAINRHFVENSPYMGLRSQLPDAYCFKTCARLTYCGLLYHSKILTSESEIASFKEYKISEVSEHIPSTAEKNLIEQLVAVLPPPSISAVAGLIKYLPIEKARILMGNKDPKFQADILDVLREDQNGGAWAQYKIQLENAAFQHTMIAQGVKALRGALDDRYDQSRLAADAIQDQAARNAAHLRLLDWRKNTLVRIERRSPWTDALPAAPRPTQEILRG